MVAVLIKVLGQHESDITQRILSDLGGQLHTNGVIVDETSLLIQLLIVVLLLCILGLPLPQLNQFILIIYHQEMHVQLTILQLLSNVSLHLHHTRLHRIDLETSCHILIIVLLELGHDVPVIRKEFLVITAYQLRKLTLLDQRYTLLRGLTVSAKETPLGFSERIQVSVNTLHVFEVICRQVVPEEPEIIKRLIQHCRLNEIITHQ